MPRESLSARSMRLYSQWRIALFGFITLCAVALSFYQYWPQPYYSGGELVNAKWSEERFERSDVGGWLSMLFGLRGAQDNGEVVIVGFDKDFSPASYEGELAGNPVLGDYVLKKGTDFDRSVYAHVLDKLAAAGARMVVFDFFFDGKGPSESGDKALAEAILRHRDKTVIGCHFTISEKPTGEEDKAQKQFRLSDPYEELLPDENASDVIGFVNVWPDANSAITLMKHAESLITMAKPSLSDKVTDWEYSLAGRAVKKLGVAIPADNRERLINFAGPAKTIKTYSVVDLLAERDWKVLSARKPFEGKVVIVGPYSELHYKDSFPTPQGQMLGVEIQANCIRTLLHRAWFARPAASLWSCAALASLLCLASWLLTVAVRTRRGALRVLLTISPCLVYLVSAVALFCFATVFLPVIPLFYAAALAATFVLCDFVHSQYERSRIKGMFGTYLSKAIVDRMVASGEEPKLGGEQVELTAFFSDVQGFSSFSEILSPEQLVTLMNEYLGPMTDILEADEGTLDKYIGDAIVAMFGAPVHVGEHEHRACACALRMQIRLGQLRAEWKSQGDKWPKKVHAMRMRIGLNTGPATVGNMGSGKRFNYTMMGDTVNLAARCESGAKSAGVYTLVSEPTALAALAAKGVDPILFRRIDLWQVKGRAAPVMMYEPVCFASDATDDTRECVRLYEAGLDKYFARDFAAAKELFDRALPLEPLQPGRDEGVEHNPAELMSERCAEYIAHPPAEGWSGVYVMTGK